MNIKCVVACVNATGSPDFYPCVVGCTNAEYDDGVHYERAEALATREGYGQCGPVYDENNGPTWLFRQLFPVAAAPTTFRHLLQELQQMNDVQLAAAMYATDPEERTYFPVLLFKAEEHREAQDGSCVDVGEHYFA